MSNTKGKSMSKQDKINHAKMRKNRKSARGRKWAAVA
jgi:hypothetical protein